MDWNDLSAADKEAIRQLSFESLLAFTRATFQFVWNEHFDVSWHHVDFCRIGEDAYFGRSLRDIVNVSPGGTKTKIFNVTFPAWCIFREYELARTLRRKHGIKAPRSTRWLLCAYSDDLVTGSTGEIQDITQSAFFQYCCPNTLRKDQQARGDWMIRDADLGTHEVYGQPLLGQITGHRAGFLDKTRFTGALLIDDPMPPRDERSFAKKDQINRNLNRVVRNRLMHDGIPIIMIQQRITTGDQTDFMRGRKALDDYRLTKIPALITADIAKRMPLERRRRMEAATGFDGKTPISYWEAQVSTEYLLRVQKNDAFLFTSQYQQSPDESKLEGVVFKKEMEALIASNRNTNLIGLKPHIPVDTYWDLGINDDMTLVLGQDVGTEWWVIGATKEHDVGLEHFLIWMVDFQAKFPWVRWGKHQGPHDLKNRNKFTAKSDKAVAMEMGMKFEKPVERPTLKRDAIEATRRLFPSIRIDERMVKTDAVHPDEWQEDRWLWAALLNYHREYDPDHEVFLNEVVHDWASHLMDGFMLRGLIKRKADLDAATANGNKASEGRSFWSR